MLVAAVEHLDALLRLTFQNAAGKRAPWKPLKIPRPVAEDDGTRTTSTTRRREATPDELLSILGAGGTTTHGG